jgi:predicted N-acyltransferase
MTIRLARQDDRDAWNRIALESAHGTYAHTWEWKETLEQGLAVRSLCLVAEKDKQLVGIYPGFLWPRFESTGRFVWAKTHLLGKAQVLWSPFCQTWDYGGPCLLSDAPNEIHQELLSEMESIAKRQRVTDIWVSPFDAGEGSCMLSQRGYQLRERFTSLIDLTQSQDDLWMNLKGETRSQIRQGQRFGLNVREATSPDGLDAFYRCLEGVASRTDIHLPSRTFFDALFQVLVPAGMARIHVVEYQQEIVGSALFLYYKGTIVARYWAALKDALKLRPYHVLIWHIITEAKQIGYHTCDFGGMPPDKDNGIYRFKKGWGVQIKHVDWYVKPIGPGRAIDIGKKLMSRLSSNGVDQAKQL